MLEISEIKDKIKNELDYLRKEYKVKEIGIFGYLVRIDSGTFFVASPMISNARITANSVFLSLMKSL